MNILSARRVATTLAPRPTNVWSRAGLAYERKAHKALAATSHCLALHNPQYYYETQYEVGPVVAVARWPGHPARSATNSGYCIPDFVLSGLNFLSADSVVVLECKLTYKPEAREKLAELYVPVLRRALRTDAIYPVVVAKNLTAAAPEPHLSLKTAVLGRLVPKGNERCPQPQPPQTARSVPVVQWLGRGEFPIGSEPNMLVT